MLKIYFQKVWKQKVLTVVNDLEPFIVEHVR